MDELEFRRRILSEPRLRDDEIQAAIAESESNAKFADELLDLDNQIKQAFQVDVPEDLADKILFNQTSTHLNEADNNVVKGNFTKRFLAYAASFAFTAGLLVGQVNWGYLISPPAHASLGATAIKHVINEAPFTDPLDEEVNSGQINKKMMPFSFQFDDSFPYHVYYLNHCGFGTSNALHVVFEGEEGRVTMFLTQIPSQSETAFNDEGMEGMVMPLSDGKSSMILVGEEGEKIGKIASKLSNMIIPM